MKKLLFLIKTRIAYADMIRALRESSLLCSMNMITCNSAFTPRKT